MWYSSGMRILLLPLFALCLQVPAKADKFWLSDPAAQQNAPEGSTPNVIEGVLIAESDEGYHVRTVGGEILLPKKSVFRIEKDSLSIDAIIQQEQQAAERRATSEAAPKAAPASARHTKRAVRAVDATTNRSDDAPNAGPTAGTDSVPDSVPATVPDRAPVGSKPSGFDPVIGREIPPTNGMSQADLMAELQLAWRLTKDKRYLVALRQLRRMR